MLKLKQKVAVIDGKRIAFVQCIIDDGKYTYPFQFADRTKRRINPYFKSLGFIVGEVEKDREIPERTITL